MTGRCAERHLKKCRSGMVYKVAFALIKGRHFCYFGCGTFEGRERLIYHLIYNHHTELWTWGLEKDLLKKSLDGKTHTAQLNSNIDQTDDTRS